MESIQIMITALLGLAVSVLFFFIIKSICVPKKVDGIKKYLKQGKTQAAIKLAKQILSKTPDNYLAHYYLGKAYLADNRSELALMEFKMVNEHAIFDEDLPELDFRKESARLYLKFNQHADALREFLLLTKMDPRNGDNFYNVGKLYEEEHRADLAVGFYKKAVQTDPRNSKAHAAMGLLLFQTKQFSDAKKEIDLALSLSPETFSNYYYLGKILKESKDYPGAIKAFEKAQRDNDYRQKALIERGGCYIAGGRMDNAAADFQRAIELDKSEAKQDTLYARYFLAAVYEKDRKIEKAIEQWNIIYARNHSFRDVAAKLAEYKDLQANDSLKDYLTSSDDAFIAICKKAALAGFSLSAQRCEIKKWGCQMFCVDAKSDDWMNMRKQVFFLRFYREPEPIEDAAIRETLDKVKENNCGKGYVFSSSDFTHTAVGFAENRPVELVGKEKLEKILQKAGA